MPKGVTARGMMRPSRPVPVIARTNEVGAGCAEARTPARKTMKQKKIFFILSKCFGFLKLTQKNT